MTTLEADRRPGAGEPRTVLVSSAALTTAVLPYFLAGTLTVSIQRDLGVSESAVGALGAVTFVSSVATAAPAGRLVDRSGAGRWQRVGVAVAGLAALTVAVVSGGWWVLAGAVCVTGASVALVDTGGARAISDRVRADRQGLAFGVKEASIPAATMVAGLAVPTLAAELGWRAAYAAAAAVALVVLLAIPRHVPRTPAVRASRDDVRPSRVARFAVGVALGAGAANGSAFFLVGAFVDRGLVEQRAALILSAASVAAIVVRIAVGVVADRPAVHPVEVMAGLLVVGGAAALVLATPVGGVAAGVAGVLLLAGGWGWTGLAFVAVVRGNPSRPGAAASVVLAGLATGSGLGPLAFGVLADRASYTASWLVAGAALATASVVVFSARSVEHDP